MDGRDTWLAVWGSALGQEVGVVPGGPCSTREAAQARADEFARDHPHCGTWVRQDDRR